MAEDNTVSRLMDQASESLMKPFMEAVQTIYIDSDFFYDFRLGTLILMVQNQEEYDYVLQQIPTYANGVSRHITDYFPKLGFTEEDVDRVENDLAYRQIVAVGSPRTQFLDDFLTFLAQINTHNAHRPMDHNLRIIVNDRRVSIPDQMWKKFVDYVHDFDKGVELIHTNYLTWEDVPEEEYKSYDMILVHDVVDFTRQGSIAQKYVMREGLVNKIVFGTAQVDKKFKTAEEEKKALDNFAGLMLMMFLRFMFVKRSIPIGK